MVDLAHPSLPGIYIAHLALTTMTFISDVIGKITNRDPFAIILALAGVVALVHFVPYFLDRHNIRRYPGPLLASLSDGWLSWIAVRGTINVAIADEHAKHGKFVRITPDQVSIADISALHTIYGHSVGHGTPVKSDLYKAFNPFHEMQTIFTTASREEHARKRKLIANTFSLKSVLDYEPVVRKYNRILMQHWDRMCASAAKGIGGTVGQCSWKVKDGYAFFDCLTWFHYQVYDIIGDLVFDGPYGMTASVSDTAQIARSREAAMNSYGLEEAKLDYISIPVVKAAHGRSQYTIAIGVLPKWLRPLFKRLPWYSWRAEAMEHITTLAVTAVVRRLKKATEVRSNNILSRYLDATDENGQRMGKVELSAEAMTLLIAGTDTTSNSSAVITHYVAAHPEVQKKLQRELDDALGPPSGETLEDGQVTAGSYEQLKHLPYLQDVLNEGLRLYSTVGIGLPRVVPEEGLTVLGETFAPGTIVSVPTYILHRDKSIWGDDADQFVPERWSRENKSEMQKAFAPFSIGPRACVGRNLAWMEMLIFLGNLFHRYEFTMIDPSYKLSIRDAFLRKPQESMVGIKRRNC
ncbi:cytochrome P450 monooxygenase [Trametopsis cervina]|nr:cytochrome P450 monooxygenase [Trametopsis cervina]